MVTLSERFESSIEHLTILGNGFDLSCKLKTSYNDFYKERYNQEIISYFGNSYFNGISNDSTSDLGLVDFILLAKIKFLDKEILWSNIETEMLNMSKEDSPYSISNLAQHYIEVFVYQNESTKPNTDDEMIIFLNKTRIINCLISKKVLQDTSSTVRLLEKNKLNREIKKILEGEFAQSINKFENSFKCFILECISINSFYEENSMKIFEGILGDTLLPSSFNKSYVISFNYTSPLQGFFYEYNNIHGNHDKESEIIFGIDEGNIDVMSPYYKFTKTYRKIMLDSSLKKQVKPLRPKINQINFFGHSLSEADYLYFQSIFDYYNIYSNPISINFYYVNYTNLVLENTINQVSNLFKKYGKTLDNVNHGKNLLHKLNLEGRLKIIYKDNRIVEVNI